MDKIDQLTEAQKIEAEIRTLRGAMMNAEREGNYNLAREYADEIERTEEVMRLLLPKGFETPKEVAEYVKDMTKEEREKWFNEEGELKEEYEEKIKNDIVKKKCKLYDNRLMDAVKFGPVLKKSELDDIIKSKSSDELIKKVEEKCIEKQRQRFINAVGKMDGELVDNVEIECELPEDKLHIAFENKKKIESGRIGSGKEYMKKELFKIFGNEFSEDDYERLASYDDVDELIDDINDTCLEKGIYDSDVIKHGISNIDRKDLMDWSIVRAKLENIFGDKFTDRDYDSVADKITEKSKAAKNNRENVLMQFERLPIKSQIYAGRMLEGLSIDDYNKKWEKEREKLAKFMSEEKLNSELTKREVQHAQSVFDNRIRNVDDDTLLNKNKLRRYLSDRMELKPYAVNKIMIGVDDIENIKSDNARSIRTKMEDVIKKYKMFKNDLVSETKLERDIDKKHKLEYGDPKRAKSNLESIITRTLYDVDMKKQGEELSNLCCEKIETDFDKIPELKDEYEWQKKHFIEDVIGKAMEKVRERAIDLLDWKEEKAVAPKEEDTFWRDVEEKHGKTQADKWRYYERMGIYSRKDIEEMIRKREKTLAAKKTTKERVDKKPRYLHPITLESEKRSIKASEPKEGRETKFYEAGLILFDKTRTPNKKYRVYGKQGEFVEFAKAKDLDSWFKTYYGD